MIQSMTGYGCSEEVCGDVAYKAEGRSEIGKSQIL